jgi:hypothetical protein
MKLVLLICCLVFLVPGCRKRGDQPLCCSAPDVEMTRGQTQCADPWGYGHNNDETITLLKNYLLQKNISVSKIELKPTGETVFCLACTCSNGNAFHVWSSARFIDSLKSVGFTVKQ